MVYQQLRASRNGLLRACVRIHKYHQNIAKWCVMQRAAQHPVSPLLCPLFTVEISAVWVLLEVTVGNHNVNVKIKHILKTFEEFLQTWNLATPFRLCFATESLKSLGLSARTALWALSTSPLPTRQVRLCRSALAARASNPTRWCRCLRCWVKFLCVCVAYSMLLNLWKWLSSGEFEAEQVNVPISNMLYILMSRSKSWSQWIDWTAGLYNNRLDCKLRA